jgi:membrane protein YdbS with pleckstrin-like domain
MKDPNAFWVWAVIIALLFLIVPYFFARSTVVIWGLPLWFLVSSAAAVVLAVFTAIIIWFRWSLECRRPN